MFSSCRGKSYIGIFIGDISSWTFRNLCKLICCYCYCWMLLLFICNCGSTTTADKEQQNYTVTTILIQTKRLNNLYRLICLLLLLLLGNFVLVHCAFTIRDEQQYQQHNYTVTTTMTIKTSIQKLVIQNWAIYVDWSFCCCCSCCY